ncbi:GntR family transcriptional regulator [Pigmentiphaga litoralis]|uniref:DNA-binding GntR family transcriptional regulator n=1 Tax=Pigmentiphaga litoralis TaxID=516702 RepID=A0A7Y9LQD5_9BURK|nr:GntR family transcriptional regulator [Pigmentiphaga litoralis]NYE26441.1 DNA-binding GntR family transcriptional regulator [Pigmentiphaga litoralis]NYE85561.1 DNA-binding GntR family transcriptional regulator [Pigmentiphaga litoralis]
MQSSQAPKSFNLREQVVRQVRSEIITGRKAPGSVYTVPGLAAELGVSTTPVREALLELSRNGLMSPMRNRGFRVEQLSLQALDDLFTMRELVERFALETLARVGLKDPQPVRALADAVAVAVEQGDVAGYIASDQAFHEALVSQAGNPLMTRMVMQLRDDMRLYGIDSEEGVQRQKASVQEHYQMIDLAIRQDVQQIGDLISRHILAWKPLFRSALAGTS